MTRRRMATLVSMVLAAMAPAWSVLGQTLSADAIRTGQPAAEIEKYVAELMPKLESGDAETMLQGRDKLLEPLKDKNASVAFRQVYSRSAVPGLQKLADGPSHNNAVNAMRVAGEIATFEAGTLLANKLGDKAHPERRLIAAAGLKRLFEAIDNSSPAISPLDAKSLAERLAAAFGAEQDLGVLQSMAPNLLAVTNVKNAAFADVRSAAFVAMCQQAGKRAAAMKGEAGDAGVLRVLADLQEKVRLAQNDVQRPLAPAAKNAAIEFQGRMLAYVVRARATFPVGQAEKRKDAAAIVMVAATAIKFGLQEQNLPFEAEGLAEDFKKAAPEGDGVFLQKALRLITTLEDAPLKLGPFNTK